MVVALATSSAWAIPQMTRYKTYGREKLTFADLNASLDNVKNYINTNFLAGGTTFTIAAGDSAIMAHLDADSLYAGDGSASTPSIAFQNDENLGFYRVSTDRLGIAANGALVMTVGPQFVSLAKPFTATSTATFSNALTVTGLADLNGDLQATTGTFSGLLGAESVTISNAVTVTGLADFNGELSSDATTETTSGTTGAIHTDGGLGVAKDLYAGKNLLLGLSGSVINWNAGDVTLTHSANALTVAGGNVGIGATPLTPFATKPLLQLGGTAALQFHAAAAASQALYLLQNAHQAADATFDYTVTDEASYYAQTSGTHAWYTAGAGGGAGTDITWGTAKLTIANDGSIVQTADSGNDTYLMRNAHATVPYGLQIDFSDAAPDDNTQYFIYAQDSTVVRAICYSDGDWQNADNAYGAISDSTLKQDIVDAESQWDIVKQLRWREYRMKSDVAAGKDEPMFGLVGQEVEQVLPEVVYESPKYKKVTVADTSEAVWKGKGLKVGWEQRALRDSLRLREGVEDSLTIVDREESVRDGTLKAVTYSHVTERGLKALQEALFRIEALESRLLLAEATIDSLKALHKR